MLQMWNMRNQEVTWLRQGHRALTENGKARSQLPVLFVQSLSRVQLCDPMDCSTPGFPVLHHLPEFAQTQVHWVSDTILPSHSLSVPFSFCLQSFPASGSFPMSQFFTSGGPSIWASASGSVLPMNIQDWSPLGWTGWTSLQSKGLSTVFSKPQFKSINSSAFSLLYSSTLTSIHDYWKNHSLD